LRLNLQKKGTAGASADRRRSRLFARVLYLIGIAVVVGYAAMAGGHGLRSAVSNPDLMQNRKLTSYMRWCSAPDGLSFLVMVAGLKAMEWR
jgi:hypothetical protein